MDRATLNIVPALRLVVVGGLFAVIWIILGAGSAHAAAPPPGESPHTADGLVTSLTAPVKPLITAVQPRTEPATQSTTAFSPIQAPASAARPVGGTAPATTPVRQPTAPAAQLVDGTVQPLLSSVTNLVDTAVTPVGAPVTGAVQPTLAPLTDLTGTAFAPITATVAQLVPGTIQPLLAPVTNRLDSITLPVTALITGPTLAPVSIGAVGDLRGRTPSAPATSTVTASTSSADADRATAVDSGPVAVRSTKAALSNARSPLPTSISDRITPLAAAYMDDGGASPQSPARLPIEHAPAMAPVLSPVSGSAGASGQAGAGAQAAADLSDRFVLPMTQGGDGSLFSFVLPGSATQAPGFSPD